MVEFLQLVQVAVGVALFLVTGFFLSKAFFKGKKTGCVEKIVFGLVLAALAPALVLVVLNLVFRVPFNAFAVYAVFIALIAASWFYLRRRPSD